MRSMRGERAADLKRRNPVTAQERIVVLSVVLCFIAFEIWLFFIAGSPLPHGT